MKQVTYILLCLLLLSGCASSRRLQENSAKDIIRTAQKYKGTRYIYGGSTPKGFDCSGFVQYVYKQHGYTLPRTSAAQSKFGRKVDRKNLKAGDLVFFKGSNKKSKNVGHVGIVTNAGRGGTFDFIHTTNNSGVHNENSETAYYKTRYVNARRIIGK